jgi:hypothetical protein
MVEEVDAARARRIAEIEKELNSQQVDILQSARNEIDQLSQKAANLKIGVVQQAQAKAASNANEITVQAAHLGEATTVHQSKGTTKIKTEVSAATTTKEAGCATATTPTKACSSSACGARESSASNTIETASI